MAEKIAVVVTRSDADDTAAAMLARQLGYKVVVPRNPSLHSVTRQVPDLILIDWAPGDIARNTQLLEEIRASAVVRRVPVCVLHSSSRDVPTSLLLTDLVVAFEIPVGLDVVKRALNRLANDVLPETASLASKPVVRSVPIVAPHTVATKVFIGHGRSSVWKELKSFLVERLKLECVDFNSDSSAGVPTADRLDQMLREAAFAFVVLTGEDPHMDGSLHARENAIHEIGLFQGRLGLKRAVVLLEDGCHEFTNIAGIGQIRFPPGGLLTKSEDIRHVLEREGLL